MSKKLISIFVLAMLAGIAIFLSILLLPRHYGEPRLRKKTGIQYWELSTGSRIAYTHFSATADKKPWPVIYLHGGPGAGITGREVEQLSQLAKDGYDVYLYDQVGCGHSGRLKNIREYTADRHRNDLEAIVHKIGAAKVILVAQSWGSILSVLFIAENPDKVAKLIITAPGNIQPPNVDLSIIQPPDSIAFRQPYVSSRHGKMISGNLRVRAMVYSARVLERKLASDAEADHVIATLTDELNKTMVCDTSKAVLSEGTEGFYVHYLTVKSLRRLQDPRPKIKNSPVPVLIMKGECDNQRWGYTTEYLQLFPHHQLAIIPGAGHNIFIEQPGLYLQAIRNYLAS